MNEVCDICCENINNTKFKKIKCINHECKLNMCKNCCKTYLLDTIDEPHCMNCKIQWSDDFLIQNLTRSFWSKDLRNHQKKILFDIEKSRLQENIIDAKIQIEIEKTSIYIHELDCTIEKLDKKIKSSKSIKSILEKKLKSIKVINDLHKQTDTQIKEYEDKIDKLKNKFYKEKDIYSSVSTYLYRLTYQSQNFSLNDDGKLMYIHNGNSSSQVTRNKFIMNCTYDNCNGFLSTQYKCSICENYTCSKCFEQIGPEKYNNQHTCKKENIESAQLIRKETKNCPTCGINIFKIDGCDQMWCIQCKTTFSWKTGKIESGKIHNPHYFEYLRQNGKNIPRDPMDIVCGGMVEYNTIRILIYQYLSKSKCDDYFATQVKIFDSNISRIIRRLLEFNNYVLRDYRNKVTDNDINKKHRIHFILNYIDENTFMRNIFNAKLKLKRDGLILQILETINLVNIDFTKELYEFIYKFTKSNNIDNLINNINKCINKYNNFIDYSQDELNKITTLYKIKNVTIWKINLIKSL